MQQIAVLRQAELVHQAGATAPAASLFRRFAAKVMVDVVPAALASLAVGCLLTQYQFGHKVLPPAAPAQAGQASAEMMQLVRDEHAAIIDYLEAQTAAEQKRYAAEDDAHAQAVTASQVAAAKAVAPAARQATSATVAVALRQTAAPRGSAPAPVIVIAAATPAAPAIGPAQRLDGGEAVAAAPPQSNSLFARTLDMEDHVVHATLHATLHAVSTIGGIPNWIASWGHGPGVDAESAADAPPQFGAAS